MDYYTVLGIPADADQETIRSAYRVLARRYHPDRGLGSSSEKFRQIVEAYETLMDAARRQEYDLSPLRRVEPATASIEPLYRENPAVFGRFDGEPSRTPFRLSYLDEFLEKWARSRSFPNR